MPEEGNGDALQLGRGRSRRGGACVNDVMVQKVTLKIDEMDTRASTKMTLNMKSRIVIAFVNSNISD